ncbi:MAG: riboflavin synthase [Candidatus Omnitrophica bacterium]|nr:riboflavin synthase [Candidatus Omnitrophota bacterium]
MFSGIVEELGEVMNISRRGNITRITVRASKAPEGAKAGDSIAVNGVCLTVVEEGAENLVFEAMPETLSATNLGSLRTGEKINLERSLVIGERLSGHFVTGHVDCVGVIRKKTRVSNNLGFEIAVKPEFMKFILPKGSVSVDGISLTIMKRESNTFWVYIIPHTLKNTTLGFKGPSDKVNIEFDILAKRAAAV